VLRFAERVPVLRVAVNAGNSTGSAGLDTNLAPSMTLGTGFAGRSSIGENLEPRHLVNWARVAYHSAADVPFGDFTGLVTGSAPDGPVPPYPIASNQPGAPGLTPVAAGAGSAGGPGGSADHGPDATASAALPDDVREQLRALIIEELSQLIKG
jgi:acetaldehyde dehydrogenase / alcohol dehydrogenase